MPAKQTIREALASAIDTLKDESESPKVDAEVLLCEVLQCNRTRLITEPSLELSDTQQQCFADFIAHRASGRPVSYIIGHQDFWTLSLDVNESTLIPRPETELLVELALSVAGAKKGHCLDLGTGTGAIALAIASEKPGWQILGTDRVSEAIALASRNQKKNNITNASFLQSHWFDEIPQQQFDLIVSNPPYVESESAYLQQGDLRFEPVSALVSGEDGLDDIRHIIQRASHFLNPQGWLLLEHGFPQAQAIRSMMHQVGMKSIVTRQDYAGHDRVTMAQINVA